MYHGTVRMIDKNKIIHIKSKNTMKVKQPALSNPHPEGRKSELSRRSNLLSPLFHGWFDIRIFNAIVSSCSGGGGGGGGEGLQH